MNKPSKKLSLEELEQLLLYFTTSMFDKHTEEEILWDVAKNCISQLGFVDCVVYLIDEQKKVLVQKAAIGFKNPRPYQVLNPISMPLGKGITGSVALTGKAEIIEDTRKDARYIVDDQPRLSEIAIPIKLNDKVIGLIDSEHPEVNYFTKQHLRILKAIASFCAAKLDRVRAATKIKEEQQKLLETQQQIIHLKAQALKAQMNPHFIFNALNAIQYFIMDEDKKAAINYLSLFGKLIRYHLKNYEADTVFLDKELEMLEWYLQLQKMRYAGKYDYHWIKKSTGKALQVKIPSLVLAALAENAVESAVFQKIELGFSNLSVEVKKTQVEMEFFYSRKNTNPEPSKYAVNYRAEMMPWQEQIQRLNQLRGYSIEEITQMVKDEEGKTIGVKTILKLPIL